MSHAVSSPAVRLTVKTVANCSTVFLMHRYLPQYFTVFGGVPAYVIVGSLLTLLNLFLRPILSLLTFPLHLLFSLLTTIGVNAVFLGVVYIVAVRMDPNVVVLTVTGGLGGWLAVSTVLGVVNWILKHL